MLRGSLILRRVFRLPILPHGFVPELRWTCQSRKRYQHATIDLSEIEIVSAPEFSTQREGSSTNAEVRPVDAAKSGTQTFASRGDIGYPTGVTVELKPDAFAKSRLSNCVRRLKGTVTTRAPLAFTTRQEGPWVKATCEFQLTTPKGAPLALKTLSCKATGYAAVAADAEIAAAMHGERIIDACGIYLFSIASSQEKHADNAHAAGRLAPYPPNHHRHHETYEKIKAAVSASGGIGKASPVLVETGSSRGADVAKAFAEDRGGKLWSGAEEEEYGDADSAGFGAVNKARKPPGCLGVSTPYDRFQNDGGIDWRVHPKAQRPPEKGSSSRIRDESEGGRFWLCDPGPPPYQSWEHGMVSPHMFDQFSTKRVSSYFAHFGVDFGQVISSELYVPRPPHRNLGLTGVTCEVPGLAANNYGKPVYALGVAHDRKLAEQLCAQHAELLIDHYGARLYPTDDVSQELHARACWGAGRYAVTSRSEDLPPRILAKRRSAPPPALREWSPASTGHKNRSIMQGLRVAPRTADELQVTYHPLIQVEPGYHVMDANPIDATDELREDVRQWIIRQHEDLYTRKLTQRLGRAARPQDVVAEAELGLFLPDMHFSFAWFSSAIRAVLVLPLPPEFGLRGGIGIGDNVPQAANLAARHAAEVLAYLGYPLYADNTKQLDYEEHRRKRGYFVRPRDPRNGQLQVAPQMSRPPPSYRSVNLEPSWIAPAAELNFVMHVDAGQFDVLSENREDPENDVVFLRTSIDLWCQKLTGKIRPAFQHYSGPQMVGPNLQTPCNTYWFRLPMPATAFGQSNARPLAEGEDQKLFDGEAPYLLAMGRGGQKKVTERACLLHALRLIAAVGHVERILPPELAAKVKMVAMRSLVTFSPALLPPGVRPLVTLPLNGVPGPVMEKSVWSRAGLAKRQYLNRKFQ